MPVQPQHPCLCARLWWALHTGCSSMLICECCLAFVSACGGTCMLYAPSCLTWCHRWYSRQCQQLSCVRMRCCCSSAPGMIQLVHGLVQQMHALHAQVVGYM